MIKVKVNWDTDGMTYEECGLPYIVDIPQMDEENIADWLSDTYGFCVFSFDYVEDNEQPTPNKKNVYIVQSRINWDTAECNDCYGIVGVADNKERAKEMLKEEVQNFCEQFNERFVSDEPNYYWGYDHKISADEVMEDDEWYEMNDSNLEVFCEVNIIEKTLNE